MWVYERYAPGLIKQKSWVDIITKITYYGQGVVGKMNELECYNYKDMGTWK